MNGRVLLSAVWLLLAAGVTPASAQRGPSIELSPFAGAVLPAGDLPERFVFSDDVASTAEFGGVEFDEALVVGGNAAIWLTSRLGIEGTFAYAPMTLTTTSDGVDAGELDLYTYGVNVSLRRPSASGPLRRMTPFLTAGIGGKTYDHGVEDVGVETDLMWNVGAGLNVRLTPALALRFEARDYMSSFDPEVATFDSELQHDVLLTTGLSFTIPR